MHWKITGRLRPFERRSRPARMAVLVRVHLAADYCGLAKALGVNGNLPEALEASQKATKILEQMVQSDRNNATLQEYLGEAYSITAVNLRKQGELDQSLDYYTQARDIFVKLARTDSTNALARDNAALVQTEVGDIVLQKGQFTSSIAQIRDTIASFEKIEHKSRYEFVGLANAYAALGRAFFSLAGQSAPRNKSKLLRESQSNYRRA